MEQGAHLDPRSAGFFDTAQIYQLPAAQQPQWHRPHRLAGVREELATAPELVGWSEVRRLKGLLNRAAKGDFCILQAGDCAEDPAETGSADVRRKIEMLDVLADIMRVGAGRPVLKVGRIAGQFAKPRSQPYETLGGLTLPVYRGAMVNSPEPLPAARVADPERMLNSRFAAQQVISSIDSLGRGEHAAPTDRVWTSHEALVLDYEVPQVRRTPDGGHYLSSTHWPWIGERTRGPGDAHVQLLARMENPVACKIGAGATADDVLELCELLNPARECGRLTLIARFGTRRVDRLGSLVSAVRRAGHPVLWMCDPMHGNTRESDDGLKIRRLDEIMDEMRQFMRIVSANSGVCAGLHMEASPNDISECDGAGIVPVQGEGYQTLCDPRLNLMQAVAVCAHWQKAPAAAQAPAGQPGKED